MAEWSGQERRKSPQYYEVLEMLRAELEAREERLVRRLNEVQNQQRDLADKLARWESNAVVVKWTVATVVSIGAYIAAAWEWSKLHLK